MKKYLWVGGLGVAAMVVTGCGSAEPTPEPTAPGVEAATDDAASPAATPGERSARGNLVKELGEAAGFTMPGSDERILTFAVKSIAVDPVCTGEFAEAPEIGHFVVLDIEAETVAQPAFDEALSGEDYQFNPHWWKFVDAEGTTANSITSTSTYSCINQAEALPDMIGPAERVTGKLVLDVPTTQGTLIFDDPISGNAWEWKIPK